MPGTKFLLQVLALLNCLFLCTSLQIKQVKHISLWRIFKWYIIYVFLNGYYIVILPQHVTEAKAVKMQLEQHKKALNDMFKALRKEGK